MKNQTIAVEPPLEQSRIHLYGKLQDLMGMLISLSSPYITDQVCSLERVQSSRYDQSIIDASSAQKTYVDLV